MTEPPGTTSPLQELMRQRREALDIAIMLMRRHLEAATPDGAGRDSKAYVVASERVETLMDLRTALDELDEPAPDLPPPSIFAAIPEGAHVETVFEVRVQGDLNGALRSVMTNSFIRSVTQVTGRQVLVIGHQEVIGPHEETRADGGL